MPHTNVHCLTPLPTKRPVDVKRRKIEYVDGPFKRNYKYKRNLQDSVAIIFRLLNNGCRHIWATNYS